MLTTRAAILQALRRGPTYGRELVRRVGAASGGRASIAPGSVYPSLKALEKARLVRTWTVIPGRARGGRARRYYELTVLGVRQAEREGEALAQIALARRSAAPLSPAEHEAMRERIERVCELHAFAIEAQTGLGRARRRP